MRTNVHALAGFHGQRRAKRNVISTGGLLVGVAGFEPATPSSRTRCATRLRYTPTLRPRLYS